jgi:hypothetical protein
MFDPFEIDRLKEIATPQHVAELYGVIFKPDGSGRIKGRCPLPSHGPQTGETPPFTVYEGGGWKCYGCNAGGSDGIDLEQAITGADFPAAIRALTERFGVQVNGISDHGFQSRIAEIYPYQNEDGQPLFEVVRFQPKDFRQRRRGEDGKWIWNLNGTRRVLYKLPEVIAAVTVGAPVWVVEGEKDANNLIQLGLPATTNPGGALKWREEYSESLRGAKIVILPDNDQPGQQHAEQVARSLAGVAREIKIIRLPGLPERGTFPTGSRSGRRTAKPRRRSGPLSNSWPTRKRPGSRSRERVLAPPPLSALIALIARRRTGLSSEKKHSTGWPVDSRGRWSPTPRPIRRRSFFSSWSLSATSSAGRRTSPSNPTSTS